MKRQVTKRRATPPWANLAAIQAVYIDAARITRETGIKHEVDHIIPISSDVVCGLHVDYNLQILTSFANKSKGNRYAA